MSENNKPAYDFDFITQALGLIPIQDESAAVNPGAIVDLQQQPDNRWVLTLHGDRKIYLEPEDMAELEETIKERAEAAREIQKEGIKGQILAQIDAAMTEEIKAAKKEQFKDEMAMQMQVAYELQNGVQPGKIVGVGKRGFH